MQKELPTINLINGLSNMVPRVAMQFNIGLRALNLGLKSEKLTPNIPIIEIAQPTTEWDKKVAEIEEAFAPVYDQEEYANAALNLMGLRGETIPILSALGIKSLNPKDYKNTLLKGFDALDIGVGPGRITCELAARGAKVTAIDLAQGYLEITRNKLVQLSQQLGRPMDVELALCPASDFPYDENLLNFDAITCMFGVFNHIENWDEVMRKMYGSLKPNGNLFASFYGGNDALVFRLLRERKLDYEPAILQRRAQNGKGILLGEKAEDILPANFPTQVEIETKSKRYGFQVKRKIPLLRLASIFPKDPTPDNIKKFFTVVEEIEPSALPYLEQFSNNPTQLLLAAFEWDWVNPGNPNDSAYIYYQFGLSRDPQDSTLRDKPMPKMPEVKKAH